MKLAILAVLLAIAALLLAILILLFLPGATFKSSQPSLRSRQAALGRAVLEAAQHDQATAAVVRAAVRAASEDDRALASGLIDSLPQP